MSNNSNKRHSRLVEYFITVGIEFESVAPINDDTISNPIRELRIISEKEPIPDGFERICTTVTGKDASLTKKGMMNRNTKHYLCYTREGQNQLFTRIQYVKFKNINQDWTRVPGKIMSGKTEYCLCTKNDESVPPIADICIITIDGKESCPEGYVKLPHTINSLAICFRHLPMDALGLRYQTCILDRYPRIDYANSPLSNTVAVFCQPNGADIRNEASMPTFLSFVLTDSEGRKMYAITVTFYDKLEEEDEQCCKRSLEQIYTEGFKPIWPDKDKTKQLYHSKSVCILSYYPFFLTFREVLKEIYRLANSPGKIPIERYIINLCEETPLPVPNQRSVQLLYAHKPIIFRIPNDDELPLLDSNIKKIFCCLSLKHTLLLFNVLITQKYKILFTSSHISLITEIMEGLTSFMQPFEWQFTYVPVLPYSVFGILDAPVPVLVGMHSSRVKPDYYSDPEKELVIVDLDNNSIHIPPQCELIEIPSNIFKSLKADLKQYSKANKVQLFDKNTIQFVDSAFNVHAMPDFHDEDDESMNMYQFNPMACRAAFYKFWIKLLGPNYLDHLIFPDNDDIMDINDLFDIDQFILKRPKQLRKFWKSFSETQAFQKFIEDLTFESSEDRVIALNAFYKCSQYEHKVGDYGDGPLGSPKYGSLTKLSSANISTSSFSNISLGPSASPISSNGHSTSNSKNGKYSQIDPFTEFLEERIPDLLPFQVPQANEDKLDEKYRFEVKSAFPTLNDRFLIKPRITNLAQMIDNVNNAPNGVFDYKQKSLSIDEHKASNGDPNGGSPKLLSPKIQLNDQDLPNGGTLARGRSRGASRSNKVGRKGSQLKYQTPMDRAKYQLLQIYGTWFASHVAALDFKDIPGDEVETVVKSTLDVLYRMSDENASRDGKIIPDELIYKACLILCGKFGKKKEAAKIFKDLKKNGITPSQKTYGAYTNAMASSGANMLLSAAGSTSSGASSLAGRTHRRSFAPQTPDFNNSKIRSLSAAINPNSRLHAPHKINTIAEDDEHEDMSNMSNPLDPTTPDYGDEQKTPVAALYKSPSSPYHAISEEKESKPPMSRHGANNSVEITLLSNESLATYDVNENGKKPDITKAKSTPNSNHLVSLSNSHSTPTPSPKIADEPEPFKHTDIKPEPWTEDETEDDDDEEQEAKESKPITTTTENSSNLNTPDTLKTTATTNTTLTVNTSTATTSSYSTPSVLSSPDSSHAAVVDQKKVESDLPGLSSEARSDSKPRRGSFSNILKGRANRTAVIVDYSTAQIEAMHACNCGYVLSDAQIMVGWCSEFNSSNTLRCIMCRQNSFEPKLHLKYNVTKMNMQSGECSFETVDKFIEYISPLQLRSKINFVLQHRRLDFEDPETFRTKNEAEFWNMIWYFYHRQLDLTFLLGEHDAAVLAVESFKNKNENDENKKDKEEDELLRLEPKSDEELLLKLKPIYEKATNGKIREAISEWLLNRSQTPSEKRDLSIWNLSVFDSFHDLAIPNKFKSYDEFVKEFKNACRNIRPKIRDRAWDEPSLAIQSCFKHPRISNQRLQQMTPKLSGKPQRPKTPVPIPPSKQ